MAKRDSTREINMQSIQLNSSPKEIHDFLLQFSDILEANHYCKVDPNITVIIGYSSNASSMKKGMSSISTTKKPGEMDTIILFIETFEKFLNITKDIPSVTLGYIHTILHELAHQVVDTMFDEEEDPHGPIWSKVYKLLLAEYDAVYATDLFYPYLEYIRKTK